MGFTYRKFSYFDVVDYFMDYKCELLTKEIDYKTVVQALNVKCKCGETFNVSYDGFKKKKYKMCNECRVELLRVISYNDTKIFIEVESKSGCKLLADINEYKSRKDKINILCPCGEEYKCSANQFESQNKYTCNSCSLERVRKMHALTLEDVVNTIEGSADNCKYISGEYKNNASLLTLKCACGENFETSLAQFTHMGKKQCNPCGFKRKGWRYSYQDALTLIGEGGCKLLTIEDEYIDSAQPLSIQCICGGKFELNLVQFRFNNGGRCSDCYREETSERFTIPYEDIKRYVEEESDSVCKLITSKEEYKNTKAPVDFQCKCGNFFTSSIHEFKSNSKRQCNKCGIGLMTIVDFLQLFENEDITNDCVLLEYENSGGHVLADSEIKLQCLCGELFETKRYLFTHRNRNKCEKCASSISKGEMRIRNCLNEIAINHQREFLFDDCRGIRKPLPFDFAIFDNNSNLMYLIEYDGKHHYKPVNFGGRSDEAALIDHEVTKKNDKIKNQYCIDNNIPLIRIPYWKFEHIEYILFEALVEHGLIEEILDEAI